MSDIASNDGGAAIAAKLGFFRPTAAQSKADAGYILFVI